MNKKRLIGLTLALGLGLGLAASASAQTYGAAYVSAITYSNQGSQTANITFNFYSEGSGTPIAANFTLAPRASGSLNVGSLGTIGAGFKGSVVIDSDQPIVATLVQLPPSSITSKTRPLANASSMGKPRLVLARAVKSTFSTTSVFAVQNADNADNDVTVTFHARDGRSVHTVKQLNLPPGASKYFDLGAMADLPATFDGSVEITAARKSGAPGRAAAIAMEFATNTGGKSATAFEATAPAASTSSTGLADIAMCQYSARQLNSSHVVLNAGTQEANVTVTFSPGGVTQTMNIPVMGAIAVNTCAAGNAAGYLGAASVSADQPVALLNRVTGGGVSRTWLSETEGAERLVAPYVRWAADSAYNVNSGTQRTFLRIQNIGDASTNGPINVRYYDGAGTLLETHTLTQLLQPAATLISNPNAAHPTNTTFSFGYAPPGGSAVIEGPPGSKLAVTVSVDSWVTYSSEGAGETYTALVPPPPMSPCGNGKLEDGETCDDGAANGTTPCGCTTTCVYGSTTTVCRAALGGCDVAETCDGAGACPVNRGNDAACVASDQCHTAGTCDLATGMCSNPAQPDGTACDDGSACTLGETCRSGACVTDNVTACVALDQCHEAGTCDPATGMCSNPARANGSTCNDGNACTQSDTCQSGGCVGGNPLTCAAPEQCHAAGTCDPATGMCSNPAKADGSTCSDGNACTQADTCQSGACVGAAPVTCAASDQCHTAGTCDPATGTCSNPARANGSACSDGDACTQVDTCQSGACVGGNPLTCAASDECHTAGTCDPATGTCSNPAKTNGSTCSDGNACTQTDTCQGGACVGGNPVTCPAPNQCRVTGTCNPATGLCSYPTKANGAPCDDGNACTVMDTCMSGICTSGPASGCVDASVDSAVDAGADAGADAPDDAGASADSAAAGDAGVDGAADAAATGPQCNQPGGLWALCNNNSDCDPAWSCLGGHCTANCSSQADCTAGGASVNCDSLASGWCFCF